MAIWFVRLHGRPEVWGRDLARLAEPIEFLITDVPDTSSSRDLQELFEAAGISLDKTLLDRYYYGFHRIDGHLFSDASGTWLLPYEDKQALRALEGAEKHLRYADILARATAPVFPEAEQAPAEVSPPRNQTTTGADPAVIAVEPSFQESRESYYALDDLVDNNEQRTESRSTRYWDDEITRIQVYEAQRCEFSLKIGVEGFVRWVVERLGKQPLFGLERRATSSGCTLQIDYYGPDTSVTLWRSQGSFSFNLLQVGIEQTFVTGNLAQGDKIVFDCYSELALVAIALFSGQMTKPPVWGQDCKEAWRMTAQTNSKADSPSVKPSTWLSELSELVVPIESMAMRLETQSAALVVSTTAAAFVTWAQEHVRIRNKRLVSVWRLIADDLPCSTVKLAPPTANYPAYRLRWGRAGYYPHSPLSGGFFLYVLDMPPDQALLRGALCDNDAEGFEVYRELIQEAAALFPTGGKVKLPELKATLDSDTQPALDAGKAPESADPRELVRNTAKAKEAYPDYNAETARMVLDAIPTAWAAYCDIGGRWAAGIIADNLPGKLTPTTVGRYLKAFLHLGIRFIEHDGQRITIPYTPRRASKHPSK